MGVHVEALAVQHHQPRDLLFVRFGAQPPHRADGIVHKFRPQHAVNRHVVRHHVAHAGQAADHADAHAPHGLHRARRRAEVPVFAAAREEDAGYARAQKAVGVVLRAVDALVDGELQFFKVVAHGFVGLHQRQRQRERIALHGVYQVLPLRIGEQQNQDAVQPLRVEPGHDGLDVGAAQRHAGKDALRHLRKR